MLSLFHHKILKMYSSITQNIKVSVIPEYDVKNSFPADNRFVFRYNIVIENLGNAPIFKSVTVYSEHEIELWKDNAWFIPHYQ